MLHLHVPKMHCGNCAGRVTRAVHTVDPGATVRPDLSTRDITVATTADEAAIRTALEKAGYPAASQPATLLGVETLGR